MRTLAYTALGTGLLLLIAYDIYATVLHASARYGPIGERLDRYVWRAARGIAKKFARERRHKILNWIGPLLLPLLAIIYVVLLIGAFALIYFPRMPSEFNVAPGADSPSWIEAIYFSGITLTTVGYGDIAPRSTAVRFLALGEAAAGFALISLTVTYLLSVYGALEKKRTVAVSLHHQTGDAGGVAGLIVHHFVDGRFYGLREVLRTATRDVQQLLESHVDHPVIHYFHPVDVYRSLPRVLFLLLETCAVIRAALDREEYSDLRNFPEVRTLEASALHVLEELVESLDLERRRRPRRQTEPEERADEERWADSFKRHVEHLSAADIKTASDLEDGWREYRERRELWEPKLIRLSKYLGYEWDEVTGDAALGALREEKRQTHTAMPDA